MARGLYYGSYRAPRVMLWSVGVIIFLVMMATAFIGLRTLKCIIESKFYLSRITRIGELSYDLGEESPKKRRKRKKSERYVSKEERKGVKLTEFQRQMLTGLMLGDMHLSKGTPRSNPRLSYTQGGVNERYMEHVFKQLENLIRTGIKGKRRKLGNIDLYFFSMSLPCL